MRRDDLVAMADELDMRLDTLREEMAWAEEDGDEDTRDEIQRQLWSLEEELDSIQVNIRNLDELGYIPGECDYYPSPLDIAIGWY